MKPSTMSCGAVVALAVLALSGQAASAAISLNSSRSNVYRLDPKDRDAAAACVKHGGVVSTDNDGQKVCTLPTPASSAAPSEPASKNSGHANEK